MTPADWVKAGIDVAALFVAALGCVLSIVWHSNKQHRENIERFHASDRAQESRFTELETKMKPVWEWFLDVREKQRRRSS